MEALFAMCPGTLGRSSNRVVSEGFRQTQKLVSSHRSETGNNRVVVFLSDGRPGPLQSRPPRKSEHADDTSIQQKGP
eukprot:scaffold524_cov183-Alexandrium_tamarense.AAC.12